MLKHTTGILLLVLSFGLAAVAQAGSPVNVDDNGVAIHGYDPVAYFTEGKPVKGSPEFSHTVDGVTWHFMNADHRDRFAKEPGKYQPQFGGYCAMGTAMGKKLDADPMTWRVIDGKLYLNLNKDIQKTWLSDTPGHIKKANENWPKIREKNAKDL